jgi:hypothetical protein
MRISYLAFRKLFLASAMVPVDAFLVKVHLEIRA